MVHPLRIPGFVILGICFILSLLISISLPYVRAFDIVRTSFGTPATVDLSDDQATEFDQATELRWGVWGACAQLESSDWSCVFTGYAYNSTIYGYAYNSTIDSYTIGSSWTSGLVIHPIAGAVIFVAWFLSFFKHINAIHVSFIVAFLGCLLTLIVFVIDIALFGHVTGQMHNIGGSTMPGPGFWMTLAVFILTAVAGCIVYFRWRRASAKSGLVRQHPLRRFIPRRR